MSIISEKLEDIRNYLDVEVHPIVSPDRWDVYAALCDMVDDLYEILEEKEPRVVKISELTSGEPMLVWLEDIDKDETVAGMVIDYVPGRIGFKLTNIGGMDRIYPLIEEYLTRWRCWNTKPSKEDMEAEPWN